MNFIRAKRLGVWTAVFAALAGVRAMAADSDVTSPVSRQQALERGKKLLAVRNVSPVTVDPFYSVAFAELLAGPGASVVSAAPVARQKTDQEILRAVAASLKPTGNFVLAGQNTLVFGQKRVKAGGLITITFEGTEYTLEITAIERTSFSLRLNREEFTRPIK